MKCVCIDQTARTCSLIRTYTFQLDDNWVLTISNLQTVFAHMRLSMFVGWLWQAKLKTGFCDKLSNFHYLQVHCGPFGPITISLAQCSSGSRALVKSLLLEQKHLEHCLFKVERTLTNPVRGSHSPEPPGGRT